MATSLSHCFKGPGLYLRPTKIQGMLLRKRVLVWIVTTCLCSVIWGQEYTFSNNALHIGIKGAVQLYGIVNQNNYGQKEMDYSVPFGFAGGLSFQYKFNARSYLLAEVLYQEQGQRYRDNFNNQSFEKTVVLNYFNVPVMFKYMVSENVSGYQGVNIAKPKWFAGGGIQVGKLTSGSIEWKLNNSLTNFSTFISDGGNPNQALLEENGVPSDDLDFFQEVDVVFVASFGFHSELNPYILTTVELRGGIGLTDINADTWRLPNRMGVYGASRTTFFGLHAGIAVRIFEED